MTAAEVLRAARDEGVRLLTDGPDLVLDADRQPPIDLIDAIKLHKPEIVSLLSAPDERSPADTRASCGMFEGERPTDLALRAEWIEERAAILEYEAGMPRGKAMSRARELYDGRTWWLTAEDLRKLEEVEEEPKEKAS